jgi:hypothetical protein
MSVAALKVLGSRMRPLWRHLRTTDLDDGYKSDVQHRVGRTATVFHFSNQRNFSSPCAKIDSEFQCSMGNLHNHIPCRQVKSKLSYIQTKSSNIIISTTSFKTLISFNAIA